jgi:hypothetical protein
VESLWVIAPLPNVGNDLHIVMRVGAKTHFGSDFVVIPDENPAKAHARRVMIAREAEVVMGIQPFILKTAKTEEGTVSIIIHRRWWPWCQNKEFSGSSERKSPHSPAHGA